MSTAAKKQRSKILSMGSVPMATAIVAAFGMSTAHAQTDDNNGSGHPDSLGRVAVAGTQPDWAKPSAEKGAVPATQVINSRIYLAGQNQDQMSALAQSVTDPASPNYHKYLTPDQVQSEFGASADQIKTVTDWAAGAGLKVVSVANGWVDVSAPASVVQAAFGTTLANYTAPDGQAHYAPSSAARIPVKVAGVIAGISGLYDTPKLNQPAAMAAPASKARPASSTWDTNGCSTYWGQKSAAGYPLPICGYDGSQLRSAYGAPAGLTGKGTTVAIVDAYGSTTMAADAATYNSQFGQQQFRPGQYREVENRSAFNNQSSCNPTSWLQEQSMDVEAVHNMAPDANIVYVGANSCEDNDLMSAYSYIVNTHAADIVSVSIDGLMHQSNGWNQSPAESAAFDRIFMKGALEGIGFNFATGDCGDNDPANAATGGNCSNESAGKQAAWPSSSAWVTAVGGTTLEVNSSGGYQGEQAWGDWSTDAAAPGHWGATHFDAGGGGGTSTDIGQPFYQRGVVPASMSQTAPNGAHLNQPMRTTPDVAMDASPSTGMALYHTVNGQGDWSPIGGTSLATPLFAGEEALQMQAHGGVAPGFENPTIYAHANDFRDVTQNGGVATIYPQAYSGSTLTSASLEVMGVDTSLKAGAKYDEATGLGSPTPAFLTASYDATRVGRLAGADRYQTGIQISQQQYPGPGSANAVVLAVGTNFPDALAGAPLAKKVGGPLLLTPGNAVDGQVVAEIHRVLKPGGKVYVLGGTNAITPAVVNGLGLPGSQITRIGGMDRYDTALKIASAMGNPGHVVLATGTGFADALSAGPFASNVFAVNGTPAAILLTNDKVMNSAVAAYAHNAKAVAAVGAQAVAAAGNAHLSNVTDKFAGFDRYDTAAQVAGKFHGEHVAGVATGLNFADALTGAAQLGAADGPLVLTNVTNLPAFSANALHGIGASLAGSGLVEIFGGPVAINVPTEYAIAGAVGGIVEG